MVYLGKFDSSVWGLAKIFIYRDMIVYLYSYGLIV
jgi:hypothetical protein